MAGEQKEDNMNDTEPITDMDGHEIEKGTPVRAPDMDGVVSSVPESRQEKIVVENDYEEGEYWCDDLKVLASHVTPTDAELDEVIQENSEKIAELVHEGVPGTTRVRLYAYRNEDGEVEASIRAENRNAVPMLGLGMGAVYLYKIAGETTHPSEEAKEYALAGNYVEKEGVDYFDHRREGPEGAQK